MLAKTLTSPAASTKRTYWKRVFAAGLLGLGLSASAQDAPQTNDSEIDDEELIVLSPFVVDAQEDAGSYRATSTLAGSRIRTDLKDVASSISVITAEFLKDTGATDNQTLLQYTTNTEVGGVYGNYAGVGGTFIDGANEGSNFIRPNNNTRVRGLDSADNTRDLFQSDIPWDAFNVGRVDLQRGPNSILFGFGSPAGIINTSINGATLGRSSGNVEFRVGKYGSMRASFDYNKVLIEDELAVRVSGVTDDTQYRQDPAFNRSDRLFAALRWSPEFLKTDSASTVIRANFEHGEVTANRPRVLPPWDHITPYFDPNAINKQSWDPYYAWATGLVSYSSSAPAPGITPNEWVVQYFGPGVQNVTAPNFVYNSADATDYVSVYQSSPGTYWGINATGGRDGGIGGFPYGSNIGIGSYADAARNADRAGLASFPAADKGFYKRKSITDPSLFDFYNLLMDGDAKREWQNWDAYNITLEQTLFDGRVGLELVYDRQEYDDGQSRNLNDPFISVDIRSNLMRYPGVFTDIAVANPNVGRAFVAGNSKNGGNSMTFTDRENVRATAFADVRFDDFMDDESFLARMLGRHVFTGVYSEETYDREERNFVRYAVDNSWSDAIGTGPSGDGTGGLSAGDTTIDWVFYLSDNLSSYNSASGLNLPRITGMHDPSGEHGILYFNSRWNAPASVNPGDYWFSNAAGYTNTPPGEDLTESENPRNYVGWETGSFQVLSAMGGDIDRLYTDVSATRRETESTALTWQAYLIDDLLVGTYGWREDTQKVRAGASSAQDVGNTDGYAYTNPPLNPLDEDTGVSEGQSRSWGLVLHTPRSIRERMPWGTNLSLTYSNGRNSRVENRYGFDGMQLPNAKGETKDYGVVISTLDDRLQFKITKYETTVTDANISSVTTEVSTLGSNTYVLRNFEAWGTGTVMGYLAGIDGQRTGEEWFWNWATVDGNNVPGAENMPGAWDSAYNDPNGALFQNHPSTAVQQAAINSWLSQMMPEEWFKAYGFNINYAAALAGDYANAIPGWEASANIGALQPSGGGRINGVWPTGTANNKSEGWEFEIVGQPTKNLNISINASKTTASQTALGESLVNFIESQYAKYQSPAGDLRLWWGGGESFRVAYQRDIWSAYQFQLQTNGKMVAEMAPWRANMIANYNFDEGRLKGTNIGLAYRWQDGRILGYSLNAAQDNLDIDSPIWSASEDHLDLWVGHERQLTEKLRWRVQVNFRNVGESPNLVPLSVQPDGSPGAFRIAEGMTWSLTNTFSF
ncbi:TonB-dependent receptor plug domain-containing protein [Actomonas aquatica]|uniref:TonB-dependent receptor plug domain-containing protein n=1 Tax=Actomonas aquatica TaxID=2866162 RepID=A0ABZ1C4F3_9BACT|nr:TonB-dependent receptor plug domain-containing protein [Opitutus sp. WL0086]WRQ86242.1 TonB-dependent receptor plug domain-containing protein [Opitutus sp. WL0086]